MGVTEIHHYAQDKRCYDSHLELKGYADTSDNRKRKSLQSKSMGERMIRSPPACFRWYPYR